MPKGLGGLFRRTSADPPDEPAASVVIVMPKGARGVIRSLNRLADHRAPDRSVEILVVANGAPHDAVSEVQAVQSRQPELRVLPLPARVEFGRAVGEGLAAARGRVVVWLSPGVEVLAGWLGSLVEALDDPQTLGVAPLVRAPDGTLAAAGWVVGADRVPTPLLEGFPAEDADFLAGLPLPLVNGPAVAFRRADLQAIAGPNPGVGEALCWADASLRLAQRRPGAFQTRTAASVVVRKPLLLPDEGERETFTKAWPDAGVNESDLWGRAGFEVHPDEPHLRRRVAVAENPPRFRWAIKNPATALGWGELWGDTHFARQLAAGLRSLGQHVVIDHREAFDRRTAHFDDVTLVIRGLTPYAGPPGTVNLAWVISHPDELTPAEAAGYDRVFAASRTWAARMSAAWGLQIECLLQATDPALFHPGRAEPDTGHPVLFVGGARAGQRALVLGSVHQGVPVSLYGLGWEDYAPPDLVKGRYLPNEELGAAYRAAGLVLNDHHEQMRAEGFLSNRLFDAAAAGARVITDDVAGLEGLFGRSVQVAPSPEDVQRLATAADLDAIFGDDAERRRVAARVHAEHSFAVRARQLLEAATEIRKQRS